jgi:hypothetical protein
LLWLIKTLFHLVMNGWFKLMNELDCSRVCSADIRFIHLIVGYLAPCLKIRFSPSIWHVWPLCKVVENSFSGTKIDNIKFAVTYKNRTKSSYKYFYQGLNETFSTYISRPKATEENTRLRFYKACNNLALSSPFRLGHWVSPPGFQQMDCSI